MNRDIRDSIAFQRATLNSEYYRILVLLVLLGALLVWTMLRSLAVGHIRLLVAQLLLTIVAIIYEAFMLRAVRASLAGKSQIPLTVWLVNAFIEAQLPTLTLIILIRNQALPPYQILVAPAMLGYYFFIILSTLRISARLSLFTAISSALGYLGVVWYVESTNPVGLDPAGFPLPVYYVYAASILVSGGVAAFVASQIRAHVMAAMREAELQSELEQVNHDLEVAQSIQEGLLPSGSPLLDDFEIAGWNKPADQTGGDYFDWHPLPGGEFAVSLADATGHGIGPALVSTSCRAYARASLLSNGHRESVLSQLNNLLAEDLPSNRFVTFAVVFVDPVNSKFRVHSAGHGPILWYHRSDDSVQNVEANGIPLGMMAGFPYGVATEGQMGRGDVLALVTDGFSEWENNEGEQFGVERLEAVLRDTRGKSAEQIITRLREAIGNFCEGTPQLDDLTVVIIRRKDNDPDEKRTAETNGGNKK
jgi:serine phosphatase RsbU (regulator of sigma subunit)